MIYLLRVLLLTGITLFFVSTTFAQNKMKDQANFDKTFSHRTAEVNGVKIHYVIGGKGDVLVLLHGFPETWHSWRRIMPALAEKYTVIAPDTRGIGDSSIPASGVYDKRTVAEDVYQLVQKLGYKQITLVGHDLGSMAAYAFAAQHPEAVNKLVVSEFVLPGFGLADNTTDDLMYVTENRRMWWFGFHAAANDTTEKLVAGRERLYFTEVAYKSGDINRDAISDADIDEYLRSYSKPGRVRVAFEYYRAFFVDAKHNRETAKRKLQMPVLAISGDHGTRKLTAKSMRNVADNLQAVQIKNCGHWLAEEQPAALTAELLRFLSGEQTNKE